MKNVRAALLSALVCLSAGGALLHAQRGPLPAFELKTAAGAAMPVQSLAIEGPWLLVHVQRRCAPCDTLLDVANSDERPNAARIVVIGSGMDEQAMSELSARYPKLAASRWIADPERAALEPLRVRAAPTVFGLKGNRIEWRLAGGPSNERELESILFSWLEKP